MGDLKHECAVAGVFGDEQAARTCRQMLHMMQHRGPEATGIATYDGAQISVHKGLGLVREVHTPDIVGNMPGAVAIGHNRYATCGGHDVDSARPYQATTLTGVEVAEAGNGDVPRYQYLRQAVNALGERYQLKTHNDGEAMLMLLIYFLDQGLEPKEAIIQLMLHPDLEGAAYSCVFIIGGELWAFRGPKGYRPLVLGRFGTAYVVASESCAFKIIGATYIREVTRGEIMHVSSEGERSYPGVKSDTKALCEFELIYFARPDSKVFGESVSEFRKRTGRKLWELYQSQFTAPFEEYLVVPVPDSSNSTAKGFSQASGMEMDFGLIRSHFAGRGFLEASQPAREEAAHEKYSADEAVVRGRRIILVDDSLVRGTTLRKLLRMLRLAGAVEVIVLIASPPFKFPCFFGIDTPTFAELIASHQSIEEIQHEIEADFLAYLTMEALNECLPKGGVDFCHACFTGNYPCADKIPPEKLQF